MRATAELLNQCVVERNKVMNEAISIVIPVYNRENLVERTLDSVFAQTYRPINLIIVDNHSSDATLEVIKKWKDLYESEKFKVLIAEEPKRGACNARESGLFLVRTAVTLFFDSDDIMLPSLVSKVMQQFRKYPDTDLVCWKRSVLGNDGKLHSKPFSKKNLLQRHLYNAMLSTQSYAAKTSLFKDAGGWNRSLMCWNDWELGLRILLRNPVIRFIDQGLVVVYPQKDSITGTNYKSKRGEWEKAITAMEEISSNQPQPLRRRLERMLLYRRINLAALYKKEGENELGKELLNSSLKNSNIHFWSKWLLRFIYFYTSHGGRGAYYLWKK